MSKRNKGKSGAIRVKSLTSDAFAAMERHEQRRDRKGVVRSVRKGPDGEAIPPLIYDPHDTGMTKGSFAAALAAHTDGARINKGARKVVNHALLQFPTDLEITPETERMMLDAAVKFVDKHHGGRAVLRGRLDRDEAGQHTVDIFYAPRYEKKTKRKAEDWISLTKFGKALSLDQFGQKQVEKLNPKTKEFEKVFDDDGNPVMADCDSGFYQGQALQTLWHEYLRDELKLDWVVRGEKKIGSDPDRLEPEEYKIQQDRAQHEALTMMDSVILHKEREKLAQEREKLAADQITFRERLAASKENYRKLVDALDKFFGAAFFGRVKTPDYPDLPDAKVDYDEMREALREERFGPVDPDPDQSDTTYGIARQQLGYFRRLSDTMNRRFDQRKVQRAELEAGEKAAQEATEAAQEARRALREVHARMEPLKATERALRASVTVLEAQKADLEADLSARAANVERGEKQIAEWKSQTLTTREVFYETGFRTLTRALKKHFTPESFKAMEKAYAAELKRNDDPTPQPPNLSSSSAPPRR